MLNGKLKRSTLGFSTRAVWSGQEPCPATGATIVPVYQTATFTLPAIGVTKGFDYSRTINPTRLAMERQLAALEGGAFECIRLWHGRSRRCNFTAFQRRS